MLQKITTPPSLLFTNSINAARIPYVYFYPHPKETQNAPGAMLAMYIIEQVRDRRLGKVCEVTIRPAISGIAGGYRAKRVQQKENNSNKK
jgi:hypothetical protein